MDSPGTAASCAAGGAGGGAGTGGEDSEGGLKELAVGLKLNEAAEGLNEKPALSVAGAAASAWSSQLSPMSDQSSRSSLEIFHSRGNEYNTQNSFS